MKVFGFLDFPRKIEFLSYSPLYRDQVLDVMKKSFYQRETVCIATEINKNIEAQKDLEILCDDVLRKGCISVVAKDVELDLIVGAAINVIQAKQKSNDGPSFFEKIRDEKFKTANATCLMDFMIIADSKVDLFEHLNVDSLLEIMFVAVLDEYGHIGIGLNLCKYSVEVAQDLKDGKDQETYSINDGPMPQAVCALFTGINTQVIGKKLGFEVMFKESFSNYSFNEKTFTERVGDPTRVYHVAAKKL